MQKLNKEQISKVRLYFEMLDILRGKEPNVTETDEELSIMISMHNLVQELGNGDPVKAAHRHKEIMQSVNDAILLTGGDQSSMKH